MKTNPTANKAAYAKGRKDALAGYASRPDYERVGLAGSYRLGYRAGERERAQRSPKRRNSMFGREAARQAKQVTRRPRASREEKPKARRTVVEKETGERGYIAKVLPDGWLKVKWDERQRPTFIKRSWLRRANPGLIELASGLQAADYLLSKVSGARKRNNPALYDALGNGVAVGSVLVGTGLHNAGRSYTVKAIKGQRVQLEPHLALGSRRRLFWTAPDHYRVDVNAGTQSNPSSDAERVRNLRLLLAGRTVDGLKMGDSGLDETWLRSQLDYYEKQEAARKARIKGRGYAYSRKPNPSPREMSKRFQGNASGAVSEFYASDSAPRLNFSRAGKLIFIKLNGKQVRIPGAVAAIDPVTEKIWLASRNRCAMFARKAARKGEVLDYGHVDAICYLTAKSHVGEGKTFEYVHAFGEEGGKKPRLWVDHEGMPILHGGDYKIKREGIVN